METGILIGSTVEEATRLAAECVVAALKGDGDRAVALAGGSTPRRLYRALVQPPWRERIAWERIHWFWGDERAVAPDHADSNYRMAHQELLGPLGIPAERVHRMPAEAGDPDRAAEEYERVIRDLVPSNAESVPVLDLVLLGLGPDGHTASLFPGSPALAERARLVISHEVPALRTRRMTMTYPLLLSVRQILFFVTGEEKAPIVSRVLNGELDRSLPAAAFREAEAITTWVLDGAAVRLVSERAVP